MSLSRRRAVLVLVVAAFIFVVRPIAQEPAAVIYGIGDLAGGGTASAVRDATRANGVIYAVGAGNANNPGADQLDTPLLWSSTGGPDGAPMLQVLPNMTDFVGTRPEGATAYAITPDADASYIASQALLSNANNLTNWVRVTRNQVPSSLANLNLSDSPGLPAKAAMALSDNGGVIYGHDVLTSPPQRRPLRYQTTAPAGANYVPLPALSATPSGYPIPRGTTDDGSVMVGFAMAGSGFTGSSVAAGPFSYPILGTNTTAFRYEHTAGTLTGTTSVIPFAPGGSWNFPIALSTFGATTVVAGNSTDYPNGEIYLTNAANVITRRLGSPNTALTPRLLGGRTADGALVVTFATNQTSIGSGTPNGTGGLGIPPNGSRLSYVWNENGWFPLGNVLRDQGMDLETLGWSPTSMAVTAVRTVDGVELISGQGIRQTFDAATGAVTSGVLEGFVIQLTAGTLAAHNVAQVPVVDESIIGAWPNGLPTVPVFFKDGSHVVLTQGAGSYQVGAEWGSYTWAGNGGEWRLTTRQDSNAVNFGQQNFSAQLGRTITVTGTPASATLQVGNTHCNPGATSAACVGAAFSRIVGSPGSVVGAWVRGNPGVTGAAGQRAVLVLTATRYYFASDEPGAANDIADAGTYSWDSATKVLTTTQVVTNNVNSSRQLSLTRDGLGLDLTDGGQTFRFTRVVAPSTVSPVFNGPFTATGETDVPFTFAVNTTYAETTTASGLPPGLNMNTTTGEISGTPTAGGSFEVQLEATNSFGLSANAILTITIKTDQAPLSVNAPSSAVFGAVFTATTTGGSGTGDLSFQTSGGCSNVSGGADITMTSGTGSCSITATKAGDDLYKPAVSDAVSVTANPATSATTLGAAPLSSSPGQPVTFTATVTSQFGGAATGIVSFKRGGTTLGTAPVSGGSAVLELTTLGVGSHVVTAIYAGDSNVTGSTSASVTATVVAPTSSTTTAIASSLNPSVAGQSVTFTATVTAAAAGTPTGTVTFRRGSTPLATVPMSGNQAVYQTSALPTGSSGINAVYNGDTNFITSTSATLTQQVNPNATTTGLTISPSPSSTVGQEVTFRATVTTSTGAVPTGIVTFKEGGTTLGTATLDASGVATFSTTTLSLGKHNGIKAVYGGDANNGNSTSVTLSHTVR